ncbi:Spindle assembly abnormal protein 6-like [Hondaea fermentalgiana]|uniref:Spindle assembly abnormal protein 6-like n=1 Tax=Hondaea fermentalgiana TaxID=2315210 RepID=A0A2R5H0D0_9STRA|nr:Spindle assembly abnormal protein 6-like [Hondaea fermentalgiana]|eukprot:GBG34513.1 Spindle assembly abnormal protein 6-like [Hondaea fermentalgiana]
MSVELDRERPVFEGTVPVRVERAPAQGGHAVEGSEGARTTELTLRVVRGVKKTLQDSHVAVLHMEVTREDDLYFLYTLQVSEEEYHELKQEQSLLVDFAGFAPKFVELLAACQRGQSGELNAGKFIAVLDLAGLPSFKIVEANQFKQLTHLALRFQPGTDASIKSYLASRLRRAQHESAQRAARISALETAALEREAKLGEAERETLRLREDLDKSAEKLLSAHAETLARQKEESLRLLSQTQNAAAEQARKQQETADRRISELESQLSALQIEHRKLYEAKAAVDADLQQMKIKNASLEKSSEDGTSELDRFRKANRELEGAVYDLEKKVSEQQLTMAALKQQLEDKEDLLAKTAAMLEQAQDRRAAVEDKMNHYKASSAKLQRKLELSIKEINKGNGVIETLQAEVRQSKDRVRTKNIVIRQQERVLQDARANLEDEREGAARLRDQLDNEKDVSAELRAALQATKERLEECNKMLESNQNVIAFLNKEINEAQLGPAGRIAAAAHASSSTSSSALSHTSSSPAGPLDFRISPRFEASAGTTSPPAPEAFPYASPHRFQLHGHHHQQQHTHASTHDDFDASTSGAGVIGAHAASSPLTRDDLGRGDSYPPHHLYSRHETHDRDGTFSGGHAAAAAATSTTPLARDSARPAASVASNTPSPPRNKIATDFVGASPTVQVQ